MLSLPLKYRLLVIIGAIIAFLAMVVFLIIIPTVCQLLELKRDISILQTQVEERYERIQHMRRSMKELDNIKILTEKLSHTSIKKGDELKIITEFEKLAEENKIKQTLNANLIEDKEKTEKNQKGGILPALPQYYQFSFLNQGLFSDHLKYLQALEKLPYYIIINNMQWEAHKSNTDKSNTVTLRFYGIVYAKDF